MQSISCQPFPKTKGTNYPAELSLGCRVPVGNPNFPSGCNSKQTEEKGKSILEMSKIFLASVIWKSICAFVNQTACLLCMQTQDKHHLSACSAPALTSGHFHYSSLKTIFLWVFLQSCKMRMFTFKSGATVMAFTSSSLWGGGVWVPGDRPHCWVQMSRRWGGGGRGHLILHTEEPTHHLPQQPHPWHLGLTCPPPWFCSSLVPRPSSLLLAGGMFFLEPILTFPLETTSDSWVWRLRSPLSVLPPGFPSSSEKLFLVWLWNQPIFKGA